jgi:3D (Asp-Asp-Asp) domain-containing protein
MTYLQRISFIALWGTFLIAMFLMVASANSRPVVVGQPLVVNTNIEHNMQYLSNTTCYVKTGYKTFSGKWPTEEMIAIRFNSKLIQKMGLKIGDKVFIEGVGIRIVEDRIPNYQCADVDVFMNSLEDCQKFGRRDLLIEKL